MEDPVPAFEEGADCVEVGDVGPVKRQRFVAFMLGEIIDAAVGEIVQDRDNVTLFEEAVDQMASNKAGPAGDEYFHMGKFQSINLATLFKAFHEILSHPKMLHKTHTGQPDCGLF